MWTQICCDCCIRGLNKHAPAVRGEQSFEKGDLLFSVSLWKFKHCQQTDISLLWVIHCWESTQRQHPAFFTSFGEKQQKRWGVCWSIGMFPGVFGGQQWPCLPSSGGHFQLPAHAGQVGFWRHMDHYVSDQAETQGSPGFVSGSNSGS